MRLPPSVRYLPSRLKFAFSPWLWLGLLIASIVGVYTWEYRQNPGQMPWQFSLTGQGDNGGNSTDLLLDSLTPEEQAVAAELDNLELLLNELDSDVSVLTSGGESSAAAALNAALSEASGANGAANESPVDRLNRYVNEYDFTGTSARGANVQPFESKPAEPSESVLNLKPFLLDDAATDSRATLPPQQPSGTPATPTSANPSLQNSASVNGASNTPEFSFDQTGVVPGSIEGLNRTFIRTTPNMSPPPGTTGYVPPNTVASPPTVQPTFSPATTQTGSGLTPALPNNFASPNSRPAAVTLPNQSQVLPPANAPAANPVVTPLDTNTANGPSIPPPGPRNAWESFFD